ncbi:MAG: hypothetical protein WDO73_33355 [Ignavibacteriota bacterium]
MNYVLDPTVANKGSVSLFTYGEQKPTDLLTLLQTILRVNGATIVQVGDLYRIIPINRISALPIDPMVNADQKSLPQDERMLLDLIFLKYSTAKEIESLVKPFFGEGAQSAIYEPANLIILQDNARNMKRTLKLIEMFDSETFAGQRVRLFEINNSRPSDLVKELETVFKSYALSEKSSAVKFIPVDRINTLIAVAPNPGIFPQVQNWIDKLDIAVATEAGAVNTYVYRLKYARAATTAMAITAPLYRQRQCADGTGGDVAAEPDWLRRRWVWRRGRRFQRRVRWGRRRFQRRVWWGRRRWVRRWRRLLGSIALAAVVVMAPVVFQTGMIPPINIATPGQLPAERSTGA